MRMIITVLLAYRRWASTRLVRQAEARAARERELRALADEANAKQILEVSRQCREQIEAAERQAAEEFSRLNRIIADRDEQISRLKSELAVRGHELSLMSQVLARDLMRRRAETSIEALRVALATSGKASQLPELDSVLNEVSPATKAG